MIKKEILTKVVCEVSEVINTEFGMKVFNKYDKNNRGTITMQNFEFLIMSIYLLIKNKKCIVQRN